VDLETGSNSRCGLKRGQKTSPLATSLAIIAYTKTVKKYAVPQKI